MINEVYALLRNPEAGSHLASTADCGIYLGSSYRQRRITPFLAGVAEALYLGSVDPVYRNMRAVQGLELLHTHPATSAYLAETFDPRVTYELPRILRPDYQRTRVIATSTAQVTLASSLENVSRLSWVVRTVTGTSVYCTDGFSALTVPNADLVCALPSGSTVSWTGALPADTLLQTTWVLPALGFVDALSQLVEGYGRQLISEAGNDSLATLFDTKGPDVHRQAAVLAAYVAGVAACPLI